MLLPFAVAMIPVLWLMLHRYKRLHAYDISPNTENINRVTYSIGFTWLLAVITLASFAFSDWSPTTFAMREHSRLANILIDAKIAINKRDYIGATPLGLAIQANDISKVKQLINQGADVNLEIVVRQSRTATRYKPLKWAAIYNKSSSEITELLRQAGAKE